MNKLQPKLKKLLKNLLYFVIGILLLISIYDLIRPNTARLTILTSPSDSKIQLNSKSVGSGSYSEILKRGSYEIIVTREGYTQETRDINLTSETNISITLTPSISSSTKTQTVRSVPLESITNTEDNIFYSVDSETGNLIKNDSGKFSTVYQGQVRSYSVQNNTAVILPYDNLSGIIILNTQNNSTRTLDLSLYAPVISVSLSEDGKIIYFLASFGIENKNSILYSIEINSNSAAKIVETKALFVEYIKDGKVLLYEDVHAIDKGVIHIVDTIQKQTVFSNNANSYLQSPNHNYIALQTSRSLKILDLGTLEISTTPLSFSDFIAWKDNGSLIVLRNRSTYIEYATITLNPISISTFTPIIEGKQVRFLYGINNNKIYFQEIDDEVLSLDLP